LCSFSPSLQDLIIHINSDLVLDTSNGSLFLDAFLSYYKSSHSYKSPVSFSYADMSNNTIVKGGSCSSAFLTRNTQNKLLKQHQLSPSYLLPVVTLNANFLVIPSRFYRHALSAFSSMRHAFADTLFAFYVNSTGYTCMTHDICAGWQVNNSRIPSYSVYYTGLLFNNPSLLANYSIHTRLYLFFKDSLMLLFSPTGFDIFYLMKFGFYTRGLLGIALTLIILLRAVVRSLIFAVKPSFFSSIL
jgi:hypothetical protein